RREGATVSAGSFVGSRLVGMLAASLLLVGMLGQAGAAQSPGDASIVLNPSWGPPTSKLKVIGSGFGPIEEVVLAFDDGQVGSVTTDGAGSFSKKFRVPGPAT